MFFFDWRYDETYEDTSLSQIDSSEQSNKKQTKNDTGFSFFSCFFQISHKTKDVTKMCLFSALVFCLNTS